MEMKYVQVRKSYHMIGIMEKISLKNKFVRK